MPLDGSGQMLYDNVTSDGFGVTKRPLTDPEDEL